MTELLPWQTPPAPIDRILNAPASSAAYVSPLGDWLLELDYPTLSALADLAEPEVAVAGFRLNPVTHTPARQMSYQRMWIQEIATQQRQPIELPSSAQINYIRWSPDGQKLAFTLKQAAGLELWVLELGVNKPWRVTEPLLNATYGTPYRWQGNDAFLCKVIPADRGPAPIAAAVPLGPSIQENLGRKTPNRTYTNLLANPHDEALFEYYVSSALETITLTGERSLLVAPALIDAAHLSPDGQYILLTTTHRPYSYQVPAGRFPKRMQILDTAGQAIQELADLPLDDQRSIKFDAVRMGPRHAHWRPDRPATLFWVEALDEGDPSQEVPHRDRWMEWSAPFTEEVQELWRSQYRYRAVNWGREDTALVWEQDYDLRLQRIWRLAPNQAAPPQMILERSSEDRYGDPGGPLMVTGLYHRKVLRFSPDGQSVYFSGRGASPAGVYPFLDRLDLTTGEKTRLWQCQDPYFETIVKTYDPETQHFITHRQSQTEPANYYLHHPAHPDSSIALTHYPDPAPEFAGIHKEIVKYTRSDGVQLSGRLYLPPGYDPQRDGPLPTLLWVYPAEFKNRELAGQTTAAENTFSRPGRSSVLFLLTQGYAILDDPKLPIIGEGEAEPNDTYVEQLIAGATAAIDYLVERGVAQRDRIGIGGHSYGAFTTANLLAHTELFQLGIARSGAYNRTLTPFGFQGEQRHFWEAIDTYHHMAPFTHAAQIKAPLLLIHGADDSNAGTYPLQTERFYEALKGLGAVVRWVELPLEDHGYQSREANGHVLWEMVRWCDRYLQGKS